MCVCVRDCDDMTAQVGLALSVRLVESSYQMLENEPILVVACVCVCSCLFVKPSRGRCGLSKPGSVRGFNVSVTRK